MESKITIENRKNISIVGVTKVKTALETKIEVEMCENDFASILGSDMHITKLDLTNNLLDVSGNINSLSFGKGIGKKNLIKKVFG